MAEYEDHLIAFIDFIGFSEASYKDPVIANKILNLLTSLASMRGDFGIEEKKQKDGNKSSKIQPAVSTFSDHIIISYPVSEMKKSGFDHFMIVFLENLIGRIALEALPQGFLLRGGITIGPLYHKQGVVFGEGLIEAYNLESRSAIYPRILISPKINAQTYPASRVVTRLDAEDGLQYFDYLKGVPRNFQPGDTYIDSLKNWVTEVSATVEHNIKLLRDTTELNKLAKWIWFKYYFNKVIGEDSFSWFLKPEETAAKYGLNQPQLP